MLQLSPMESNEVPATGSRLDKAAENIQQHEELLRREARLLHIPEGSLSHETVRRFVQVHIDTSTLQMNLGDDVSSSEVAANAALRSRYRCTELLLRGALHLLREGFHGQRLDRNYLKAKLGSAARFYGLDLIVTDKEGGKWRQFLPSQKPEAMWHTEHNPPPLAVYDDRKPQDRSSPAHMARLRLEADRYGIPEDMAAVDPVLHNLLTHIADAKDLVRSTESGVALPEARGLYPTAQDRLARVAHLSRAVVSVLAEEFHPGTYPPNAFSSELDLAVRPYGLAVLPSGRSGALSRITKPAQDL
jgi:hypothetical protein